MHLLWESRFFLLNSEASKVSKLVTVRAGFIKRTGLAEVGDRGIGSQSPCPEDLYSLPGGVKELHIDLVGKVVHVLPLDEVTS